MRLRMAGGDISQDVSEHRLGANEWCQVRARGVHRFAMKNLKQAGADLWSFCVREGPVHAEGSC